MVTSADIVNAAITQSGNNQPLVTGTPPNFDNSTAGKAAAQLYTRCVQTVGREFGWDFSRNLAALTLSGNSPPLGYAFEYLYPTNGIQIRQLIPAAPDPNNPLPINWVVGNNMVGGTPKKVIWTNAATPQAAFSNMPPESLWDPLFVEAVVRMLAAEFASGISGRPDTARDMLTTSGQFEKIGEIRGES